MTKEMKCKTCDNTEKVDDNTKSVVCCKCVAEMTPAIVQEDENGLDEEYYNSLLTMIDPLVDWRKVKSKPLDN